MFYAHFEGGPFHNQPARFKSVMTQVLMLGDSAQLYELQRIERRPDASGKLMRVAIYGMRKA